ncbi:hypothetical protein JCM5353_005200 [Sporobolomyces roseus]
MRRKQIARKSTGGRAPRKQLVVDERSSNYMDRATPGPDLTSDEDGGAGSRREERAIETESSQGKTNSGTTSGIVERDMDDQQMVIGGSSELSQGGAGNSGSANQHFTISDQAQSPEERIVELRRNIQELEKEVKELEERVVSKDPPPFDKMNGQAMKPKRYSFGWGPGPYGDCLRIRSHSPHPSNQRAPDVQPAPEPKEKVNELSRLRDRTHFRAMGNIDEAELLSSKSIETRSAKRKRLAGESVDRAGEGKVDEEEQSGGDEEKKRARFGNVRNAKKVKAVAEVDEEGEEAEQRIKDWRKQTQEVEEEVEELK